MLNNETNDQHLMLRHKNLTLQWVSSKGWFATRGYEVWHSNDEGRAWNKLSNIKSGFLSSVSTYPLFAQAGRLGIHNLIQLQSGTVLCIADGIVFRSIDLGVNFSAHFSSFMGRRPMRMGLCQDNLGRIYLGEYSYNRDMEAVHLWRSDDDALNWSPVYTWTSGAIRHIHFVQYDPFEKNIWLGTGDDDNECQISYSTDGGYSFQPVGVGTQLWRAGSLLFTAEALYWGTDIGIDHNNQLNYIIRLDRKNGDINKLQPAQGPTYYSTQLSDGTLVMGTCVEQANHHNDNYPHLLWSKDHNRWNDMSFWPKLMLPNVIGPATITFPLSDAPLKSLLFNVNLTRKYNGSLFELNI